MKAVLKRRKEPGIEIVDVGVPEIGDGDILVKVAVTSVCGSDVHLYEWEEEGEGTPWWDPMLTVPVILGHEFSGEVVDVGSKVTKATVGDRITASPLMPCGSCSKCQGGSPELCLDSIVGMQINGSMAEYVRLTSSASVYKFPVHVSYEAASLLEPLAVALHAVELSDFKPGDTAAVFGPGPIGLLALQVLKAAGASVTIITGTNADKKRLDMAEKIGADVVVDVERDDLADQIKRVTDGEGVDFVFEASGNPKTVSQALGVVKTCGKVVLIGMYAGAASVYPNDVVVGRRTVIGSLGYEAQTWRRSVALVKNGLVRPEVIVDHKLPLMEAEAGFELLARKEAVKVLLVP